MNDSSGTALKHELKPFEAQFLSTNGPVFTAKTSIFNIFWGLVHKTKVRPTENEKSEKPRNIYVIANL